MADSAKQAIRNSFIKLLNEKPLKQISVKDIVEDCGVNRNTFYYHYQDIPSLLETIVEEDTNRIISKYSEISSLEDCLLAITDFALANKRAVFHIYNSAKKDFYEQHLLRICHFMVSTYIDRILDGHNIKSADRDFIIGYYECLAFGMTIKWLSTKMKDDIEVFIHKLSKIKQGELEKMIESCEQKTK